MDALKEAVERMTRAHSTFRTARDEMNAAEAEVLRLQFLAFVDEHPEVTGFTFETEYEYDDEGGYYRTASMYATYEDKVGLDEIDGYDFVDAVRDGASIEAICILCGVDPDDGHEGEVTVAEARERRF